MRLVSVACVGVVIVVVPFCAALTSAQDGDVQHEDGIRKRRHLLSRKVNDLAVQC